MPRHTQFSLPNLRLLDSGRIDAAFTAEVERVVKDCLDRPADATGRSVNIKFTFKPQLEGQMGAVDCDTVKVEGEITSTVPKRRSRLYEMTPNRAGQLQFNPDLPDEPDQSTLFEQQEIEEDSDG